MAEETLPALLINREPRYTPAADRRQPACEGKDSTLGFSHFPIHRRSLVVTVVLSALILQGPLFSSLTQAQVTTAITSDGTLNTQVVQSSNVHDITGGSRPGNGPTLFQSFGDFSVGEGDVANFLNDSGLSTSNILSRVTGGNPSSIFGSVQTEGFGNANLFLMNPAGIIFGPSASLKVGGAAHFTTADYLRLGDGVQFTALPGAHDPLLSVAPVAAFGFLNENPAGIAYDGSSETRSDFNVPQGDMLSLQVREGEVLSLVGGDIQITGNFDPNEFNFDNTAVSAPGGQLNVVSVASAGEVVIDDSGLITDYNVQAFEQLGAVRLTEGAKLDVSDERGGTALIRSGTLVLETSDVFADTGGEDGIPLAIDIEVTGDVTVIDGFLTADTTGAGTGGDIRISSTNLRLIGTPFDEDIPGAVIGSRTTGKQAGAGASGNVEITLGSFRKSTQTKAPSVLLSSGLIGNTEIGSLQIEGQAEITATTFGPGQAGNIEVSADNVSISEPPGSIFNTGILANTFESGQGGSIQLTAGNVSLNRSSIESASKGTGNAGAVTLNLSGRLNLQPGSVILGDAGTTGNAAEINISAQDINITGIRDAVDPTDRLGGMFTGFDTSTNEAGRGGNVNISAASLRMTDQGIIRTSTSGSGEGGAINVSVGQLSLSNGASVTAGSTSGSDDAGNAGNIQLTATDTILLDEATVTTEAVQASGGNINLQAEEMIRLNDSTISSSVQGSATTVGGNISLDPEFIILENSQILAKAVEGQGGNISLVATNAVLVDPLSVLDASSALGVSGSVDIQAPIQNLSGTIAPLPEETTPVTALYGARCAAGQGGHFSTFVDSKADSFSPTPGMFLASPLLSPSAQGQLDTSAGSQSPVVLTASIAPQVLGLAGEPTTACP